jgi:hypothetical protein
MDSITLPGVGEGDIGSMDAESEYERCGIEW